MKKRAFIYLVFFTANALAIELEPIKIESSKLDETFMDSAQTVDIVNRTKIDATQISDVKDLSSIIPNTNISGIGDRSARTFTLRGISNYVTYESSVAMYIDDVAVPFSFGYGVLDWNNIASIEVAKGPQGTQYGKNAESGVISVYTKPISKTFSSEAQIGMGSYNSKEFYGRVSGPVNDKLSYSFSAGKVTRDGFSDNVLTGKSFDDREMNGYSGKLLFRPDSHWDLALNTTNISTDDGGTAFKVDTKENPRSIDNEPFNDFSKMDNNLISALVRYHANNYTFTSTTSYAKESVKRNDYVDISGGVVLDFDVNIEEVTQEMRVNYIKNNFDLLVGLFYSDKLNFDYLEKQYIYHLPTISSVNNLENPDENKAFFTEFKYTITPRYSVNAGVRFQETTRSFERDLNLFTQPVTHADVETKWRHILPSLCFSYYPHENGQLYARYAKGYRPGGYNYRAPTTTLVPYEPEIADSYELGYKEMTVDGLTLSSALFYNDITDHRVIVFFDDLSTQTRNADHAYSYGAELSINYEQADWSIFSVLGMTQAKYKNFTAGAQDYSGNHLLDVPDMTLSIGGKYQLDSYFYAQSDIRYMGKRYYNIENTASESGYETVNIAVGYERDGWKTLAYVNNVFDKEYVDFMIHTPSHDYCHFGDPRVVGIKVSKNF